jgi:UDP-N-acetylmuramate--alanine ligase
MKLKVGIIFGGKSREREISFAGGRTVYDNLDKSLFEPIPLFADHQGNLILLDWQYIYKGSIRDFFPPATYTPLGEEFQFYADSLPKIPPRQLAMSVGKHISISDLPRYIDFAFLTLHGTGGEDGSIQGLLQYMGIPYTASGILPSAIGMDKLFQKRMMQHANFATPKYTAITRKQWLNADVEQRKNIFDQTVAQIGLPLVVKAANQGSSIGVSKVNSDNFDDFDAAVFNSLFITHLSAEKWQKLNIDQRKEYIRQTCDLRTGIGIPLFLSFDSDQLNNSPAAMASLAQQNKKTTHLTTTTDGKTPKTQLYFDPINNSFTAEPTIVSFPSDLLKALNYLLLPPEPANDEYAEPHLLAQPLTQVRLSATSVEHEVLIESFLRGREFSCIVIRTDDGKVLALPPTEIRKGEEIFDYRAKYLAGLSSKQTPIDLPNDTIRLIQRECERLFTFFGFHTYARIDGFINKENTIYLNDPNTTSGMLPSSFFFHQAAEIGLNPSQFLTYIVRSSIAERSQTCSDSYPYEQLLQALDYQIEQQRSNPKIKKRIGVILGGYSSERHISVESGRNIYEKLASSDEYQPIPLFLTGNSKNYELYEIPINILLKDNADDIAEKVKNYVQHPITAEIKADCANFIKKYTANQASVAKPRHIPLSVLKQQVDAVFIALHGRPGEDGELQRQLQKQAIPFNGSGYLASQVTIDKYETNQLLKQHGFKIAEQTLVKRKHWSEDFDGLIKTIEHKYNYPLIAKPADDGCSAAVKKIKNRSELLAYCALIFRTEPDLSPSAAALLKLKPKEEFPMKEAFLIETLIEKGDAKHFLEITGGLVTHYTSKDVWRYEMFEPSETLASDEVLSLEEKFLAGEGQNITPARYANDPSERKRIAQIVMAELERAAKTIGIEGYARIDAFVKIYADKVETYIIEVNSLPGMTPATCIFHQCAINGYTPFQFIDTIIKYGMQRQNYNLR